MHHCDLRNTHPSHPKAIHVGCPAHSRQPPGSTMMHARAVGLQRRDVLRREIPLVQLPGITRHLGRERDAMMVALAAEVPGYAWELNKGYFAPEHVAALETHGPSVHHRRSWRLPGVSGTANVDCFGVTGMGVPEIAVMHDEGAVRTERGGGQ